MANPLSLYEKEKKKRAKRFFLVLLAAFCMSMLLWQVLHVGPWFKTRPEAYTFLLFPRANTLLFADENLVTPIGKLEHAIGADGIEMKKKVIRVEGYSELSGYVSREDLLFLPGKDPVPYLRKWQERLSGQGVQGEWKVTIGYVRTVAGRPFMTSYEKAPYVELTLSQDAKMRKFTYTTDGVNLHNVYPYYRENSVTRAWTLTFFLIILAVGIYGWRIIKKNEAEQILMRNQKKKR